MFDFANSAYTTVVITAVYNAYFVATVAERAPHATLAWTLALSLSYALIMLSAPAIGRYADRRHAKKKLLLIITVINVLATLALAYTGPGTVALALGLIVLSNFAFGTGENLCAAFLPELAKADSLGRVSGWGWSLGYLGGLFSLGLCLVFIGWAQARGWTAAEFVPGCMVITAVSFALGTLPTFLLLRERGHSSRAPGPTVSTWAHLRQSLQQLRGLPDLFRLLLAIVSYQAGIQTVIVLAAVFAQEALGFGTQQTIAMLFVVNITAALGAFVFGFLQDRLGHRACLSGSLVLWIIAIAVLALAEGTTAFWIAANLAGLALGAAQSAGRALVGFLSPYAQRAEFFGLWGLAVKLGSIIGPLSYGLTEYLSGNNHRIAMAMTAVFFVIGLGILAGLNADRGRRLVHTV
ncbi:MAG: MFS transporter [Ahniella sp.]|nr:MFS transporter [Ahniella sp.]